MFTKHFYFCMSSFRYQSSVLLHFSFSLRFVRISRFVIFLMNCYIKLFNGHLEPLETYVRENDELSDSCSSILPGNVCVHNSFSPHRHGSIMSKKLLKNVYAKLKSSTRTI